MYAAPAFRQDNIAELQEMMQAIGFATIAANGPDGLVAAHIPLSLDADDSRPGTLRGHVARANPFWRAVGAGTDVLAIFLGPHHYVSPGWYPSKREHGRVVPTWNYVAVHAAARATVVDDPSWLHAHVTALSKRHESARPEPWAVTDAPDDYIATMIQGIVGLELVISKLEGIKKLSQNRGADDRAGVIAGLETRTDAGAASVASLMRARD